MKTEDLSHWKKICLEEIQEQSLSWDNKEEVCEYIMNFIISKIQDKYKISL